MKSIKFPKIFNSVSTNIVTDKEATFNNLYILLRSEMGELFGDPYFGINLKRYIFEQNNNVLRDILVDEIYNQIKVFMPQLTVTRKDITITTDKAKIYAHIKGINKLDFTNNTYNLVLYEE